MEKFDESQSQQAEAKMHEQLDSIETLPNKKLKIAVVGRVSTGKSSLINALFNVSRHEEKKVQVGAISGVTTKIKEIQWSKNITVIDSPGLGDVIKENSQETRNILSDIDVGILVVSGSVDESQKAHYDELKEYAGKVFVVMNKIDEYDKKPKALEQVVQQWHDKLGLQNDDIIFRTCTDGYDPEYDPEAEMDIRGIDELRDAMLDYLKKHGKNLLLMREMYTKSQSARKIIYGALVAVGIAAFVPGSAIYITGIQAGAIMSIHYVYTGEILSKKSAIAAIPLFASQSIGSNMFLWAKSVLPPTGVLDMAAAGVAIAVTFAMLISVNWFYENGYDLNSLENKTELKEQFKHFYKVIKSIRAEELLDIVKDRGKLIELIAKFVQ
ncbi:MULTISPECIES: GTPase [unclassified Moraxella]|uniref:GTPase n=1 Tax=unclassified Moraxella TaxID=2685852 RepID=UPI003AF764E5